MLEEQKALNELIKTPEKEAYVICAVNVLRFFYWAVNLT